MPALSRYAAVVACATLLTVQDSMAEKPPAPVEVVNTPTVNLNANEANPVPVQDVDRATREPVHFSCFCELPGGEVLANVVLPVPSGKQLVIEYVSARVGVPTGEVPELRVQTATGNLEAAGTTTASHFVALQQRGSHDIYDASQLVRLYSDPSTDVVLQLRRNIYSPPPLDPMSFQISLSGYYVDF